jgi:hypothetical protein
VSNPGYITLPRDWREMLGLQPSAEFSESEAFLWLIEKCAHKEVTRWNKKGEPIQLQAGQIHVSARSLASAWGWPRTRVQRFLDRLEARNLTSRSWASRGPVSGPVAGQSAGQSGTIITICNWGQYQGGGAGRWASPSPKSGPASFKKRATQEERRREEGRISLAAELPLACAAPTANPAPAAGAELDLGDGGKPPRYEFEGKVVRLKAADYKQWQAAYPSLDLRALLTARDAWLASRPPKERRSWFISTSTWLANKQQAATEQAQRQRARPVFTGPC